MNRQACYIACIALSSAGVAYGQSHAGRTGTELQSARLVPLPPARITTLSPVTVRPPAVRTWPANQPIITRRTTVPSDWQSTPAASIAPTLAPSACSCCGAATVLRPVVGPAQPIPGYYIGRGLLGQPKLYVSGQQVRNLMRYISP